MELELQPVSRPDTRLRRGLAISAVVHLLLLAFFLWNPDFFSSSARRVVRVTGEDYDLEPFDVVELYVPPDLVQPAPAPEAVPVVPVPEAAAPPPPPPAPEPEPPTPAPELPPLPPPAVITPDTVIAEGARPDAPENGSEEAEPAQGEDGPPPPAEIALDEGPDTGPEGEGGDEGDGRAATDEETETTQREARLRPPDVSAAGENTNADALRLPSLRSQAESIIDEAAAMDARSGTGDSGRGRIQRPNLSTESPTILSDTRGYDFGPYMNQVINRVRTSWYSLIPDSARIGVSKGRVVVVFTITESGRIENLDVPVSSGVSALDRAAVAAIQASNPFQRLPADFDGDRLVLQFTFLYNIPPDTQ